jgi:site-specific DNA-cytosine methylase
MITDVDIRVYHGFGGLGGGAKGFNRGQARVANMRARFRCIGGFDVDPAACRDFLKLAGVPLTCIDLFDRAQYTAFHGHEPPAGWREATPDDIRRSAWYERPHIVFLSAPCKGFSGLLSETRSQSGKYQALNQLAIRALWLMLEAWADDPPELFILENVPRIISRGKALIDQITALFQSFNYVVTTPPNLVHDCGEIGGLAQSRKRFLMVARHQAKVPAFLYQPPKRPLRAVGEILSRMPLPGDPRGGPMHGIPNLQWKTWVRLAFVEAGSDWRSLNKLRVADGKLQDYLIVPNYRPDAFGVLNWDEAAGCVSGRGGATNGAYSVADPRTQKDYFHNAFRVSPWDEHRGAVTGGDGATNSGGAVADPRFNSSDDFGQYGVRRWDAVADPRIEAQRSGPYGVVPWTEPCGAIASQGGHDNGRFSVADPRVETPLHAMPSVVDVPLPAEKEKLICIIRSLDGTWHRPFTTLELAALQSLVDPEEMFSDQPFDLVGNSDSSKRERIGNAVPPGAAEVIAGVMGEALLASLSGERFQLSAQPVWVQPIAIALSVRPINFEPEVCQ